MSLTIDNAEYRTTITRGTSARSAESEAPDMSRKLSQSPEALKYIFGLNFKAARLETGLNQAEIGRVVGLRQSRISLVEKGLMNPTLRTLGDLAAAVQVNLHDLFDPKFLKNSERVIAEAAALAAAENQLSKAKPLAKPKKPAQKAKGKANGTGKPMTVKSRTKNRKAASAVTRKAR